MIVKKGKELRAAVIGSVFLLIAGVLLLSPLRDQVSRHGFPVWLLAVAVAFGGLVLWIGALVNLLQRRK